jgi:hypothetical protein
MVLQTIGFILIVVASVLPADAQDQQPRRQAGWPCIGTVDRSYARNAEATGGKVFLFRKTELAGVAQEMSASAAHEETVFRVSGQLTPGTYNFDVPIDSTIESGYFFVSLQCLEALEIVTPSGDTLDPDQDGIEYHRYAAVHMATVKQPVPGMWKVRVTGSGVLSMVVSAKTDLRLGNVTLTDAGERAIFASRRETPLRLEASISGLADQIAFQFISSSAAPIQSVDVTPEKETNADRTYVADVIPPATEFRLAVTGIDPKGFRFQRVQKQLMIAEQ